MALKGVEARRAARSTEKARLALIDDLLAKAAQPVAPPPVQPDQEAYLASRLARIRKQLDLIDTRIEQEASKATCDGQLINWLCSAQERLAEQERITAGRPGPGTLKPSQPAKPSAASARTLPVPRLPEPPPSPAPAPQEEPPEPPAPSWRAEPPDF